jgi:hypothetical protein
MVGVVGCTSGMSRSVPGAAPVAAEGPITVEAAGDAGAVPAPLDRPGPVAPWPSAAWPGDVAPTWAPDVVPAWPPGAGPVPGVGVRPEAAGPSTSPLTRAPVELLVAAPGPSSEVALTPGEAVGPGAAVLARVP